MRDTTTRVLLIIIGIGNAVVGLWAAVAPQSFYDDFPGAGRHWVAVDGPYNEHLVRDVGVLNLALAAIVVAVLLRPERYLVMVVAAAELVYSTPHFLYHLAHLDIFGWVPREQPGRPQGGEPQAARALFAYFRKELGS